MADKAAQAEWVQRVLGIDMSAGGAVGATKMAGGRPKLMPIWIDAKEAVDEGIGKLQTALRSTGDGDLEQIAEFGLFGATEGENVAMMKALREADGGAENGLRLVRDAVADYRDFLAGAPIVDLIEKNPFGVTVPMRRTLGAALKELDDLAKAA